MIKFILSGPEGPLTLYGISINNNYFTCEAYVASAAMPDGTVFNLVYNGYQLKVKTLQPIRPGVHAYPGDPEDFGRLEDMPLFALVEDTHEHPQSAQ